MSFETSVVELTVKLAEVGIKNTAQIVYDKIRTVKSKSNDKETINALEEIINDLISDKNELVQIAKCYEQEFVAQKISEKDIEYITDKLLPLLLKIPGMQEEQDTLEILLSQETLKILQLLGFNYKEAIGEPLTSVIANAINGLAKKESTVKTSGKNKK